MVCFCFTPVAQPFICNAEKEKLSEPAGPTPSRTHHTNLGQGHHYTGLTSDPTGVHQTAGIKQRLTADVVEDLIKFSFGHISESLPPTCTDSEALISLSGVPDVSQMNGGGFVVDSEQRCGKVLLTLNMVERFQT